MPSLVSTGNKACQVESATLRSDNHTMQHAGNVQCTSCTHHNLAKCVQTSFVFIKPFLVPLVCAIVLYTKFKVLMNDVTFIYCI